MRQVRVHGPGDVRVDEIAEPDPGPPSRGGGGRLRNLRQRSLLHPHGRRGRATGNPDVPGPRDRRHGRVGRCRRGVVRVGDRVVVHPGDDERGRIGNGAAQGGSPPSCWSPRWTGDGCSGARRPPPRHRRLQRTAGRRDARRRPGRRRRMVTGVAVFGCGPIGLAAIATLVDRGHRAGRRHRPQSCPARARSRARRPSSDRTRRHRCVGRTRPPARDPPFIFGPTPATRGIHRGLRGARVITDVLEHGPVGGRLSWWRSTTSRSRPATSCCS